MLVRERSQNAIATTRCFPYQWRMTPTTTPARTRLAMAVLCAAWLGVAMWARGAQAVDDAPFGLDHRVPLTTSRVVGSPDPPLPYRAVRAFPKLSFTRSLYVAIEPGSDRLLIVEQAGKIIAFKNDPAAEQTELFHSLTNHDFYSLRFHPDYARNRQVFIFANGPNSAKRKQNRILRYTVTTDSPRRVDPASENLILAYDSNGHNGGEMDFGKDGMLYISSGDGTSDSDGDNTGQDIRDLNSGVIRIDVDHPEPGKTYAIPKDNPFWHIPDARHELWAYGFRNPWRLSFDRKTGDLWVGDIGQDLWEMIEVVQRGANYGWSIKEGSHPFHPLRQRGPTPISPPTIEHSHAEARSITGGIVYYGSRLPELRGAYIYGDYGTGKIWGARYSRGKVTWHRELGVTPYQILAFAEGQHGELFFVDFGGALYELEPAPPEKVKTMFPRKLSETGLFASVKGHVVQPALIPYSVNAQLWSDGAHKERFMAVPGLEQIGFSESGAWQFPERTVLVKTFSLDLEAGRIETRQRIETRLLVLQQKEWVGYTYAWNQEQTEATLIESRGLDRDFIIKDAAAPGGRRKQTWHYPSRAECMVCHSRAAGFVLGLSTPQLNRAHDYGGVTDNQLRTYEHLGLLKVKVPPPKLKSGEPKPPDGFTNALPERPDKLLAMVDPGDAAASLDLRARSYLHANCSHCHVEAGGGNAAFSISFTTKRDAVKLIGIAPLHDKFGNPDALLVAPGQPEQSLLVNRVERLGPGRMPPLASSLVDEAAAKLLREWILHLKPDDKTKSERKPP